jgi:hypothetical protein
MEARRNPAGTTSDSDDDFASLGRANSYQRLTGRTDSYSAKRARLESKSAVVPEAHRLDRLLRYERNLDRQYDRLVNLLLRLQQIRKGQPVPPTLNVNVST